MPDAYMPQAQTVEWYTPPEVFDPLHKEFQFTLDVCAADENAAKCDKFIPPLVDSLTQIWRPDRCWMNPPYGRGIAAWVKKAAEADTLVVGLLPARTDTAWWHEFVLRPKAEVRFMRGRVKFLRPDGTRGDAAPFPTVIVIWR